MAEVILKKVCKAFGKTVAVGDIDLQIEDREFVVLFGPSGCGKSTTLRMVAGLEDLTRGEICIGGQIVNDMAPKDRDVAMVFQSYALYPYATVYENMAFALRVRKYPKPEIQRRVEAAEVHSELGVEAAIFNLSGVSPSSFDLKLPWPPTGSWPELDLLSAIVPFRYLGWHLAGERGIVPEKMRYPGLSRRLKTKTRMGT